MSVRKSDLTVYVFVLAVMVSTVWLAEQIGTDWSPTLLVVIGVVAAGWTAYHRYRIEPGSDFGRPDRPAPDPDGDRSSGEARAADDADGPDDDRRPESSPWK